MDQYSYYAAYLRYAKTREIFWVQKSYKFWLVVSGMNETQDAIFFNNLKIDLLSNLRSVLSRNIVDEVEILPSDEFVGKLSEHTITS